MSLPTITIKNGDTLQITCNYKQTGTSTPIDLSSFVITATILNDNDFPIIVVNSTDNDANRKISTGSLSTGEFTLTILDTEILTEDTYYIDFKYTTPSNIEQTSKAIKLSVKAKLV